VIYKGVDCGFDAFSVGICPIYNNHGLLTGQRKEQSGGNDVEEQSVAGGWGEVVGIGVKGGVGERWRQRF